MRRTMLAASSALAVAACGAPPPLNGPSEATAIYRDSRRADSVLQFRGPALPPDARDTAPETALTVDVALVLAKRNSARLAELEKRVVAADAAVETAAQHVNPQLNVPNVHVGRAIESAKDLQVTPRIRFFPERPGEVPARVAEARAAASEVRAQARAETLAIEAEVRWLFDDIVLLDAEIGTVERVAGARRRLASQTHDKQGTSTATSVEVSFADLHAILADGQLAERRARRALVEEALLDLLGRPAGTRLVLDGNPAAWPPPPLPSEQALIELALRSRPEVAGTAARIDRARAQVRLERGRRWPWFRFLEVGYELRPANTSFPLFTLGTGIELPVFNSNGGAIREAEETQAAARAQLDADVQNIAREVRARLREVNAAAALVTAFREVALPAIDASRAATERAMETGSIDTVRALIVEERRCYVEVELFERVRKYRAAVDALRRAVGGPLPSPSDGSTGTSGEPH